MAEMEQVVRSARGRETTQVRQDILRFPVHPAIPALNRIPAMVAVRISFLIRTRTSAESVEALVFGGMQAKGKPPSAGLLL